MAEAQPRALSIALSLAPQPGLSDELRRFVERLAAAAGLPDGRDGQLATAVYELFENAARIGGGDVVDLAVAVDPREDRVTVAVTNACDAAQFASLRARLDRLNAEPDPLHAYVDTIRRTPHDVRGGIGLPRVRYESELTLDARHDGLRVTLTARGRLAARAAAPTDEERHG